MRVISTLPHPPNQIGIYSRHSVLAVFCQTRCDEFMKTWRMDGKRCLILQAPRYMKPDPKSYGNDESSGETSTSNTWKNNTADFTWSGKFSNRYIGRNIILDTTSNALVGMWVCRCVLIRERDQFARGNGQ